MRIFAKSPSYGEIKGFAINVQLLEPPHASVEAVVDVLMKTDLSSAGIEALEAAMRGLNRPVNAPHQQTPHPQFGAPKPQANGAHPLHLAVRPGQPPHPPFGAALLGQPNGEKPSRLHLMIAVIIVLKMGMPSDNVWEELLWPS